MFVKQFKPRSNIQLKGSDKKRLKTRILSKFPTLTDDQISNVLSNKATVCSVKAVTHTDQNVLIYTVDKKPYFFELSDDKILPTVYALWEFPDMIPMFTTHPDVLPKLANGADLMIPGIVKSGNDLKSWGNHRKDEIFGINLTSNKSAIAVGTLAHCSNDLYMCGGRGIAVRVLHVFGDKLWGMEPSVLAQPPVLAPVISVPKMNDDEFPALGSVKNIIKSEPQQLTDLRVKTEAISNQMSGVALIDRLEDDVPEIDLKEEMSPDDILKHGFLNCLKLEGPKLQLPILTSTFYPQHIQPALDSPVDIKKTTFKKVSNFLRQMEKDGFIVINEEQKGIEKIVSVNLEHSDLIGFRPIKKGKQNPETSEPKAQLLLTKMTEIYVVDEKTDKLFANFNHQIGSKLDEKQIKNHIKDYVGRNQLLDKSTQKVNLDPILSEICGKEGTLSIEDINNIVRMNMNATFEMRTQDKAVVKGGKRAVIHITTATRTGNKKVTIISNLDLYGINVPEFAKAVKLKVAGSTCMTEVPGYKTEQLLVQGNHVRFIYDLLVETYKIPRGNITGLEFAKKDKKKK